VVPIHGAAHRPVYLGHGQLIVPIENIGPGPALDVTIYVNPRKDNGGVSEAWGDRRQTGAAAGVGASQVAPIEVRVWGLDGLPSFDFWATYMDVTGREWVTAAKYRPSEEGSRYTNMWISEVPAKTSAVRWLGFDSDRPARNGHRGEPRSGADRHAQARQAH
jgi:hypothetical protein